MTQWIKHNGGPRPVPPDTMVEIVHRGRDWRPVGPAKNMNWYHYGEVGDITEYRVIEPAKEETVQAIRTEFPPHPFIIGTGEPSYEERLRDEVAMEFAMKIIEVERKFPDSNQEAETMLKNVFGFADIFIAARKKKEGGM